MLKAFGHGFRRDALFWIYNHLFFSLSLTVFTLSVTMCEKKGNIYSPLPHTLWSCLWEIWKKKKKMVDGKNSWNSDAANWTPSVTLFPESWRICIPGSSTSLRRWMMKNDTEERKFPKAVPGLIIWLTEPHHLKTRRSFLRLAQQQGKENSLASLVGRLPCSALHSVFLLLTLWWQASGQQRHPRQRPCDTISLGNNICSCRIHCLCLVQWKQKHYC